MTLWSGEVTGAERQAFERWLAAHDEHRTAWEDIHRVDERLRAVPGVVAQVALRPGPARHATRRRALRGFAALAGAGLAVYAVRETRPWQMALADQRTARGERRELVLPDGTRVTLNTSSAITLDFSPAQRLVRLVRGELLVTTAHAAEDRDRPFVVETDEGRVLALGTRFTVRRLEDAQAGRAQVQVFEGAVAVTPRSGATPLRLEAGQQARFDAADVEAPSPVDAAALAWARGLLWAERMRLDDFLAELSRYRPGVLRCDPSVGGLLVSGVYPLADTDAVLQSIGQALPVQVRTLTRWWVRVEAR
ncbi:MAG: FecR domain-containing protein [Pseudacidovorax sp.]|nr:FecR domain-containing protein [Pseudacidovorax sp.]